MGAVYIILRSFQGSGLLLYIYNRALVANGDSMATGFGLREPKAMGSQGLKNFEIVLDIVIQCVTVAV